MKSLVKANILSLIAILACMASCHNSGNDEFVRQMKFNSGWKFHYGDVTDIFTDTLAADSWQNIDLPHDWSVLLPLSETSVGGTATGYAQGGTGWYLKNFTLTAGQAGKLLSLYFEGSYMETEVWLNGRKIAFHPYGYTSFFCDITSYCFPAGKENSLAVKVINQGKNSRWYSGSGIYRNVWLLETDKVHINTWGTYITTPVVTREKAQVNISTDVLNETVNPVSAKLCASICKTAHKPVVKKEVRLTLMPGKQESVKLEFNISDPELWSTDDPELYTAEISLIVNGNLKDRIVVPFGIRSISFSAEKGFLLNGQPVKLKGGCIHHDNGVLGGAAIDRAEERKAELLKTNGFNAVRCAHNPPSEKFLETCDKLGILVIDESFDQWQKPKNPDDYHRFFDEWNERDYISMLLRDRNHPSIIMWSIGNEIQERADSSGIRIENNFRRLINKYDPSRPMTLAFNDFWDNPQYTWNDSERTFSQLDVCGYNYLWWHYETDHKQFPDRVIFGSESTPQERAINWDLVEKNSYVIGDFVWTAMDYLGETGIGHALYVKDWKKGQPQLLEWPCFNAWCGDIDICGNKKPQAVLRDILWNNSPIAIMVHEPGPAGMAEKVSYWGWPKEIPSWNWHGHENQTLEVRVFTRYPSVRLYLNGKLIGERPISKDTTSRYIAGFKVKYEPGILKAVGVDNGTEKESISLETTGAASKIKLLADRTVLKNSRDDLSYVQVDLTDEKGRLVQDDDRQLNITVSGAGEIAGSGNASPCDVESFRSLQPGTFRGRALVILRPTGTAGKIELTVSLKGLPAQKLIIQVDENDQ